MKSILVSILLLQATLAAGPLELHNRALNDLNIEKSTYHEYGRLIKFYKKQKIHNIIEGLLVAVMPLGLYLIFPDISFSNYFRAFLAATLVLSLLEGYVQFHKMRDNGRSFASSLTRGCLSANKVLLVQPIGAGVFYLASVSLPYAEFVHYQVHIKRIVSMLDQGYGLENAKNLSDLLVKTRSYLMNDQESFRNMVEMELPEHAQNLDLVASHITDLLSSEMIINRNNIIQSRYKLLNMVKLLMVDWPLDGDLFAFFQNVYDGQVLGENYRRRVHLEYGEDFRIIVNALDKKMVMNNLYKTILHTRYPSEILRDFYRIVSNGLGIVADEEFDDDIDPYFKLIMKDWNAKEAVLDAAYEPKEIKRNPIDVIRNQGIVFSHPITMEELTNKQEIKSALELQNKSSQVDMRDIDNKLETLAELMKHRPQGNFALRPSALWRKAPLYPYTSMKSDQARAKGIEVFIEFEKEVDHLGDLTNHEVVTTSRDRLIFMMSSIYTPQEIGRLVRIRPVQ